MSKFQTSPVTFCYVCNVNIEKINDKKDVQLFQNIIEKRKLPCSRNIERVLERIESGKNEENNDQIDAAC